MKKTMICIVAAVAEPTESGRSKPILNAEKQQRPIKKEGKKVIGIDNSLPWSIPEDLRYFKRLTLGYPVIMGRKTFDSIGKPLPGRTNIVVTRNDEWRHPECIRAESLSAAIQIGEKTIGETLPLSEPKIFVIGGGQIYAEAMPLADRLYLTEVCYKKSGDVFFPGYSEWRQKYTSRRRYDTPALLGGEKIPFHFVVYERKK